MNMGNRSLTEKNTWGLFLGSFLYTLDHDDSPMERTWNGVHPQQDGQLKQNWGFHPKIEVIKPVSFYHENIFKTIPIISPFQTHEVPCKIARSWHCWRKNEKSASGHGDWLGGWQLGDYCPGHRIIFSTPAVYQNGFLPCFTHFSLANIEKHTISLHENWNITQPYKPFTLRTLRFHVDLCWPQISWTPMGCFIWAVHLKSNVCFLESATQSINQPLWSLPSAAVFGRSRRIPSGKLT